jgi:hypothetical protein
LVRGLTKKRAASASSNPDCECVYNSIFGLPGIIGRTAIKVLPVPVFKRFFFSGPVLIVDLDGFALESNLSLQICKFIIHFMYILFCITVLKNIRHSPTLPGPSYVAHFIYWAIPNIFKPTGKKS